MCNSSNHNHDFIRQLFQFGILYTRRISFAGVYVIPALIRREKRTSILKQMKSCPPSALIHMSNLYSLYFSRLKILFHYDFISFLFLCIVRNNSNHSSNAFSSPLLLQVFRSGGNYFSSVQKHLSTVSPLLLSSCMYLELI